MQRDEHRRAVGGREIGIRHHDVRMNTERCLDGGVRDRDAGGDVESGLLELLGDELDESGMRIDDEADVLLRAIGNRSVVNRHHEKDHSLLLGFVSPVQVPALPRPPEDRPGTWYRIRRRSPRRPCRRSA